MSKFYITGIAGTGKSTLAQELNKRGITALDMDSVPSLCHWKNKVTGEKGEYKSGIGKDWIEAHNWICDVVKLQELLDKYSDNIVIVGIASNRDEYILLFDKVFLLHCGEETLLRRLSTRDTNVFAKEKSEQEQLLGWYKDFEEKMLKYGAVPINTEEPINVVADRIVAEMQ